MIFICLTFSHQVYIIENELIIPFDNPFLCFGTVFENGLLKQNLYV